MAQSSELEWIQLLREAIDKADVSLESIAKECKTSHGQLSRFVSSQRSLTLPTAIRLYIYFGFKLVPPDAEPLLRRRKKRTNNNEEAKET